MKGQFLKTFASLGLSALLAYAGVSWAYDNCLHDSEKSTHEQSAIAGWDNQSSFNRDARSNTEPLGELHCLITFHGFDAIVTSTSVTSLLQFRKSIQLKRFAFGSFPSAREIISFVKHRRFTPLLSSSPSSLLSLQLLLSVFLIWSCFYFCGIRLSCFRQLILRDEADFDSARRFRCPIPARTVQWPMNLWSKQPWKQQNNFSEH